MFYSNVPALEKGADGGMNSESWGLKYGRDRIQDISCAIFWYRAQRDASGQVAAGDFDLCPDVPGMAQTSLVPNLIKLSTVAYTHPPADLALWVRDTGMDLGFIPRTAYAQGTEGIGFAGLSVLLPLWKVFRNIAYVFLALIMIVIGFMIMLRKKIDPKTVVTVQNALPGIIIALVLITFSYAIAGFLIDVMYFSIFTAGQILSTVSLPGVTPFPATQGFTYAKMNFLQLGGQLLVGGKQAIDDVMALIFESAPGQLIEGGFAFGSLLRFFFVAPLTAGSVASTAALALAPPLLLIAILFLAFVIGWFRLLFMLISSYVQIIISVLLSPLQLLTSALPGSTAFESWVKNLIANLAVFPITAIFIMIGNIMTNYDTLSSQKLWGPPFLNPGGNHGMAGIIGLGLLFTIPNIAGAVKEALKAKAVVNAGPSAIIGPVGSAAGQTMNLLYQLSMVQHFIPHPEGSKSGGGGGGGGHRP